MTTLKDIEKREILEAVRRHKHITRAASELGISKTKIYRKLKAYGICISKRIVKDHLLSQIEKNVPSST